MMRDAGNISAAVHEQYDMEPQIDREDGSIVIEQEHGRESDLIIPID